jgi:hypothetical protein
MNRKKRAVHTCPYNEGGKNITTSDKRMAERERDKEEEIAYRRGRGKELNLNDEWEWMGGSFETWKGRDERTLTLKCHRAFASNALSLRGASINKASIQASPSFLSPSDLGRMSFLEPSL